MWALEFIETLCTSSSFRLFSYINVRRADSRLFADKTFLARTNKTFIVTITTAPQRRAQHTVVWPVGLHLHFIRRGLSLAPTIHSQSKKLCHYTFVHHNLLANLKNSFTFVLSEIFATKPMLYFPPHLKCVAALPCKIRKIEIGEILLHLTQ